MYVAATGWTTRRSQEAWAPQGNMQLDTTTALAISCQKSAELAVVFSEIQGQQEQQPIWQEQEAEGGDSCSFGCANCNCQM